jgi:hypothetical protein
MVLGTGQLQHKEKQEAVANGLQLVPFDLCAMGVFRGNFRWRSLSSTPFLNSTGPRSLSGLGAWGTLSEITRGSGTRLGAWDKSIIKRKKNYR